MHNPARLGDILRSRGKHMSRERLQRPTVKEWTSRGGINYWRAEWRQYIDGRPKPKHRVETWSQKDYSKSKAQKACDAMVAEETGSVKADGSLTVEQFWDRVHWPILSRKIAPNSRKTYTAIWRTWILPTIGHIELQRVTKHAVEVVLGKLADAGRSQQTAQTCLSIMESMFSEAVDNAYLAKNPAHNIRPPRCKQAEETRPLDESEVRRLFAKTTGRDRLIWQVLILTGERISEVLALKRDDLVDGGLRIDQSAYQGRGEATKSRKTRFVSIPESLRIELEAWAAKQDGDLLFPRRDGLMFHRTSWTLSEMLDRARTAAELPHLTFRCCRTTFATLFDGDPRDLQEMLGHSSMTMTSRYRRVRVSRQKASVEELAARLSEKVVSISDKRQAG